MKQWVCIRIDSKIMRRGDAPGAVRAEMKKIFGDNLLDVVIVGDTLSPDFFESTSENYIFVKCLNYFENTDKLRQSKMVVAVLDNYDHPNFCDEGEVKKFAQHVGTDDRDYRYGDLICVREGYLKGLRGVVIRSAKSGYFVFFRLYTRSFMEELSSSNLIFEKNIRDFFRFPVTIRAKKNKSGKLCFPQGAINNDVAKILARREKSEHENKVRRRRHRNGCTG